MQSDHTILSYKQLVQVQCELKELELTQDLFWLIFMNYFKTEKSLSCYFCQINSTQDLEVGPVALDRSFPKLSNNIKFIKIGWVDLKLFNFKHCISLPFI
jgi:hypothetical protein